MSKPLAIGACPRRVLIIVENLPVPFDRRVWAEAQTLRKAGYEVSVICPKGKFAERAREEIEGIHVYRHHLPQASGVAGYFVEYSVALASEFWLSLVVLRRHGFDVVHGCNPPDLIWLIGLFYKLLGKKFVFDHHDLNPELFEAKFGHRGVLWRVVSLLERLTFKVADISIATNESYRHIAIKRGRMDPDRVFTVRSGPNLDRVRRYPSNPAWRQGRAFLVAYIGVIGEQEGIDLLLEAAQHVAQVRRRDDVQFVIMGEGPARAAAMALAKRLGLSEHVAFTGRVDDPTLFEVLSTADVCVNPDRPTAMNDMSTMNKIMEYMAMGKPIVQFDLTEGRVSAGEASLYARNTDVADFGDKILKLLDAPERRAQMGAFGEHRVRSQLAWSYEAPKLLAAYDALYANALKPVRSTNQQEALDHNLPVRSRDEV